MEMPPADSLSQPTVIPSGEAESLPTIIGGRAVEPPPPPEPPFAPVSPSAPPAPSGGNSKRNIIIAVVVAVVLLCCCCPAVLGGLYALSQNLQ